MTRIRRLLFTALLPAMVLVAATTASTVGKPQDKVNVCHRTGNGSFHEINISRNALPAHMRHGDVMTDEYGDCPGDQGGAGQNDQDENEDQDDDRGGDHDQSHNGDNDQGENDQDENDRGGDD